MITIPILVVAAFAAFAFASPRTRHYEWSGAELVRVLRSKKDVPCDCVVCVAKRALNLGLP